MSDEPFQERPHTIVVDEAHSITVWLLKLIIISEVSYYHLLEQQCINKNTDITLIYLLNGILLS